MWLIIWLRGIELNECGHDKATQQSNPLVVLFCQLMDLTTVDPFSDGSCSSGFLRRRRLQDIGSYLLFMDDHLILIHKNPQKYTRPKYFQFYTHNWLVAHFITCLSSCINSENHHHQTPLIALLIDRLPGES